MYLRDTVFILKSEPFREHDSRVTMYGRVHGKMSAVARGSRRMSAKHLGHLEPLTVAEVMIAHGQSFDKLAIARRVTVSSPDLASLALAGAFSSLVDSLVGFGVPETALFDLLLQTRDVFVDGGIPTPERARFLYAAATLKLLDILGYAPVLDDKLFKFMRSASLYDLKRLTAPVDQLSTASAVVEDALTHTPLHRAPHGSATIVALLS